MTTKKTISILKGVQFLQSQFAQRTENNVNTVNTFKRQVFSNSSPIIQSIRQCEDEGFVLAGVKDGQVWIGRVDTVGEEVWEREIGAGHAMSVFVTGDNHFLLTGRRDNNLLLIKTTNEGEVKWEETYNDADNIFRLTGLKVIGDAEGIVVVGYARAEYGNGPMPGIIKRSLALWLENDGNVKKVVVGEQDNSILKSVAKLSNNNLALVGSENNSYTVTIIDPQGQELWKRSFGESSGQAEELWEARNGDLLIVGVAYANNSSSQKLKLVRLSATGDDIWAKDFGNVIGQHPPKVVQETSDGSIVVMGTYMTGIVNTDICLLKTDPNGVLLWEKIFHEEGVEYIVSGQETIDKGLVFLGYYYHGASRGSTLIKTNSSGELVD